MRKDARIAYKADSHRLKHKQEQNNNVAESRRDKNTRSRVEKKTDSQFSQKTHIEINHRLNQLFYAEQKHHFIYQ